MLQPHLRAQKRRKMRKTASQTMATKYQRRVDAQVDRTAKVASRAAGAVNKVASRATKALKAVSSAAREDSKAASRAVRAVNKVADRPLLRHQHLVRLSKTPSTNWRTCCNDQPGWLGRAC